MLDQFKKSSQDHFFQHVGKKMDDGLDFHNPLLERRAIKGLGGAL